MAIENINKHYSMNNPASIYDEEALTTLELVGRLANKVVEVVDLVNKNELTIGEAITQLDKDFNEAKQYMVDNLPDFVENSVESLKNSGALETMLVNAIESKKLDKDGVESITYAMLSQQIKEMFTGGNTPVVAEESVSTANIVNNSVSEIKLRRVLHDCEFFTSAKEDYYKPLLIVDTTAKTASINPEYTSTIRLNTREKYHSINPSNLVVNTTGWTSANPDFYYNPDNNEIRVADGTKTTSYSQYIYLGGVRVNGYAVSSVIPVEVNGDFYLSNSSPSIKQLPLQVYDPKLYVNTQHWNQISTAIFDFNFNTSTVTFLKTSSFNLVVEGVTFKVNLSTIQAVVESGNTGSHYQVFYNPYKNIMYFDKTEDNFVSSRANCLYLGLITKATVSMSSTCIIPYTIDGTYYVHPNKMERDRAELILSNTIDDSSPVVAKVDFKGRAMTIPAKTRMTIGLNSNYLDMTTDTTNDVIIPFGDSSSNFQYLVGGESGLMFVPYNQFRSISNSRNINQLYYFGYVNEINHDIHLRCKAEKLRYYAVFGDSISTYEGVCPAEHTCYYKGNNGGITSPSLTWWGRVANRCGLELVGNVAWSGLRVTPRSGNPNLDGVYFAHSKVENIVHDPEIIFVYMGINDYNHNTPLGEWDRKAEIDLTYDCSQTHYFIESYAKMIETLKQSFPTSEIYCLTLPNCERHGSTSSQIEVNDIGLAVWEYNDAIKMVCETLNVNVIDTATCHFTHHNADLYFTDYNSSTEGFLHPNAEGMKVIANKVIKAILDTKEID